MTIILNIDKDKFSLNGIPYFKNFMPHVIDSKLRIVNVYDTNFELSPLASIDQYTVNGVVHTTVLALQTALVSVVFSRDTLGAVNEFLLGSITPTSVPTGTGKAFWPATQAGTYTNFGGFTIPANTFAVFSRDGSGAFSVSMTALDITGKVNVSDIKNDLVSTDVNKPLSANQGKVLNGKIVVNTNSLSAKAGLVVGKNKFNKTTSTIGYFIDPVLGTISVNASYDASDFIAVLPSTQYVCNDLMRHVAFFDNNYQVLTGGINSAVVTFTTASNVYFARISTYASKINTFQLEIGSTSTVYEAYKLSISPSQLPVSSNLNILDRTDITNSVTSKAVDTYLVNPSVNLWTKTEDIADGKYGVSNLVKDATSVLNYKGISLKKISGNSFYSSIQTNLSGNVINIFEVGKRYLMSYYILNLSGSEQLIWTRPLANGSSNGHAPKLIDGKVRRVWKLVQATAINAVDDLPIPTSDFGLNGSASSCWLFNGATGGTGALDLRIGGFQVEKINNDSYVDGVALIGDSTMAGSSGKYDRPDSREVSSFASALLNVPFYNRAVGGERTDTMDARWATDITPLAKNCKYAIIQGGINDIAQSRALADIKVSIQSMVTKAITDGMTPIVMTCTPTSTISATPSMEADRLLLNTWIKTTFPLAMDIAKIVANPANPSLLRTEWAGDGTHYSLGAKRAIANAVAKWEFWDFITPKPYRQVLVTTPTMENPFEIKIGEIKAVQGIDIFAASNEISLSNRGTVI